MTWIARGSNFLYVGSIYACREVSMRPRSLVSILVLCSGLLVGGFPLSVDAAGSALEEGEALLAEIHTLASEASSRASDAEAAQPVRVAVASCLGQIARTLISFEATASTSLGSLKVAVRGGDTATARDELELLLLTLKNAKAAAATAAACDAGTVGAGDETSSGGILGLDELPVAEEGSGDDFVPDGQRVGEGATLDVVTSPLVTP